MIATPKIRAGTIAEWGGDEALLLTNLRHEKLWDRLEARSVVDSASAEEISIYCTTALDLTTLDNTLSLACWHAGRFCKTLVRLIYHDGLHHILISQRLQDERRRGHVTINRRLLALFYSTSKMARKCVYAESDADLVRISQWSLDRREEYTSVNMTLACSTTWWTIGYSSIETVSHQHTICGPH